jgi:hypothetical protein
MANPYKPIPLSGTNRTDQAIEQGGTAIAGAFGPWWGALAQAGGKLSTKVMGDKMDETKNAIGYELDPFKHLKSIAGGFKDPKRFLETIPLLGSGLAGKRIKREEMAAQQADANERAKADATRSSAFYNAEMQRLGGGTGIFSLSDIPQ